MTFQPSTPGSPPVQQRSSVSVHSLRLRPHPHPHILIVDDNPLDTELVQVVLSLLAPDAQVAVLHDPVEALEYLAFEGPYTQRERVQPDLVLLDINMPCMHGFEVLATLRADPQTRFLNIVLCSTSDDRDDMRVGRELGANGYLVKPPTISKLQALLQQALLAWTPHTA